MGDPDQGVGPQQPGGWIYAIMPYMEEDAVARIGAGLPWDDKSKELAKQMAHPVQVFNCPSRRAATTYPAKRSTDGAFCDGGKAPKNVDEMSITEVAKSDYAINQGPGMPNGAGGGGGAPSIQCLTQGGVFGDKVHGNYPNCDWPHKIADLKDNFKGVSVFRLGARMDQITGGASNTLLVGEKSVQPRFYDGLCEATGANPSKCNGGDNNSMYQGHDQDSSRAGWGGLDSLDRDDNESECGHGQGNFGGPHPSGVNIALCDGSVKTIDFEIDSRVWGPYIDREKGTER